MLQALLLYLQAAELGMEIGQSNAAWMLDRGYGHAGPNAAIVAFNLYRRSAEQGNVQSLLVLGDSYYYGNGVAQDWVRAAAVYYEAYHQRSAEAIYNLGFMHEFGAGVPKDLSLAQRFYDMAKHTMPTAALPVYVASIWLKLHGTWEWVAPYLPHQLDRLIGRVFVLQPALVDKAGSGDGLLAGLMPKWLSLHWESFAWRLTDFTGLSLLIAGWEEFSDIGETALLLLLLIVLWVVLHVRRQRLQAVQARVRADVQRGDPRPQQIAAQLHMDIPAAQQPPQAEAANGEQHQQTHDQQQQWSPQGSYGQPAEVEQQPQPQPQPQLQPQQLQQQASDPADSQQSASDAATSNDQ